MSTREEPRSGEPVRAAPAAARPARSARPGSQRVGAAGNRAVHRMVTAGRRAGGPPPGIGLAVLSGAGGRALHRLAAPVQPKLSVSRPGDPLERAADAMAARVTAGPAGAAPAPARPPSLLSRQVTAGGGAPVEPSLPPATEALLRSPGTGVALAPAVRERIEGHLGADLTGVQVHAGPDAALAAAGLQARAFTVGGHIFLGAGESADDLGLMAHEATHVVQQGAVDVYRAVADYLPDFIMDGVRAAARSFPPYRPLTVVMGYDPVEDRDVPQTPESMVGALLESVPYGSDIAARLGDLHVLQDAFEFVRRGLVDNRLTLDRFTAEIGQAWDEMSADKLIDGNIEVLERHVDAVWADLVAFARSIVDAVVQLIRDAAVGFAEEHLAGTPVWELAKKVIHYDPLRGEPVDAPTVEILADFLRLIGQDVALAEMEKNGTLQRTADWLDLQSIRFLSLIAELGALFAAAWDAIQPANLPNLIPNLEALWRDAVAFVQRVAAFATEVLATVVRFIKDALLGKLSEHAHKIPGYRLLTAFLAVDPFTGQQVPRTAENLIGGFFELIPGGAATFEELASSGVLDEALGRITGAMGRLGISLEMITNTFRAVWDTLELADLFDPVAAFERVLDQFGEPLGRIVEFFAEVVQIVITLILQLMNFPSDLLGSIIGNALQAIEDIKRDPVGFLVNMLAAVKAGLSGFFDNILQYLLQGLSDWLFRGLGQLGIAIPADLSLQSILNLVLQVLGVTAETLWQKLGEHIGAENVARIRAALDALTGAWAFIKDIQERGLVALWEYVQSQLSNLWDTILDAAKDWIMTEIVEAVVAKLISMLDPSGVMAVVNSFIAFFNAIESAIEYIRDILEIINKYVTTFAAVAKGDIGPGAAMLEQGFASSIPVAIGFLANQVGIGNVPEKVVEIIQSLRQLVDAALDWLFEQAMRLGAAALSALTGAGPGAGAGEQPSAPAGPATGDPEHDARVTAGLNAIAVAETSYLVNGEISAEDAAKVAASVKAEHPVFTLLRVVDGVDSWDYEWAASPGGTHSTAATKKDWRVAVSLPEVLAEYEQKATTKLPTVVQEVLDEQETTATRERIGELRGEFEELIAPFRSLGLEDDPSLTPAQRAQAIEILREVRKLARKDFKNVQQSVWRRLRQDTELQDLETKLREAGDISTSTTGAVQVRSVSAQGDISFRSLNLEHRIRLSDSPWLYNGPDNLMVTDAPQNQQYLERIRAAGVWPTDPIEEFIIRFQLNDQGINFAPGSA